MLNDWQMVVASSPPDALFEDWKRRHPDQAKCLAPRDIRIDTIRTADAPLRRYWVKLPTPAQ